MPNTIYPYLFSDSWDCFDDYIEYYGWTPHTERPDDFYEAIAENMQRYVWELNDVEEWDDDELYFKHIINCSHGGYIIKDFYHNDEVEDSSDEEEEEEEELKQIGWLPQTRLGECAGCKRICEECERLVIVEEDDEVFDAILEVSQMGNQ